MSAGPPSSKPAAARGSSSSAGQWRVDTQYSTLLALMLMLSYVYAITPSGLQYQNVFDDDALTEAVGVGPWFKVQWLPLFMFSLWVIGKRFMLMTHLLPHVNRYMLMMCGWMLVSCLWSYDPGTTIRQSIIIIGVVMMAMALQLASWQRDRFETIVRWTLTGVCILSLIVALAIPNVGIHNSSQFELMGSWRGITQAKYFLGHAAQISAMLWGYLWATRRARSWQVLPGIALSLLLLLKSRSNTSLIVLLVGLALMAIILRPPLRLRHTGLTVRIGLVLAMFVPAFAYIVFVGDISYRSIMEPVSGYFGKDITISGRTFIWEEVWRVINSSARHFWIGQGYMTFWRWPPSEETIRILGWPCPDAHNGYLDIWNELGLIGVLLLVGYLARHIRQLNEVRRVDQATYALHFAILVMMMIENLTATGWFRPITPVFLLMTYSSFSLARILLEQRLQQAFSVQQKSASGNKILLGG